MNKRRQGDEEMSRPSAQQNNALSHLCRSYGSVLAGAALILVSTPTESRSATNAITLQPAASCQDLRERVVELTVDQLMQQYQNRRQRHQALPQGEPPRCVLRAPSVASAPPAKGAVVLGWSGPAHLSAPACIHLWGTGHAHHRGGHLPTGPATDRAAA